MVLVHSQLQLISEAQQDEEQLEMLNQEYGCQSTKGERFEKKIAQNMLDFYS